MEGKRIPFSKEEENRIASAGRWGMIAAICAISTVSLSSLLIFFSRSTTSVFAGKIGGIIGLILNIIMGVWLIQASQAFLKIAQTDEADEHYLLLGFSKLRSYFKFIGVLVIIGICLAVFAGLVVFTCSLFIWPKKYSGG